MTAPTITFPDLRRLSDFLADVQESLILASMTAPNDVTILRARTAQKSMVNDAIWTLGLLDTQRFYWVGPLVAELNQAAETTPGIERVIRPISEGRKVQQLVATFIASKLDSTSLFGSDSTQSGSDLDSRRKVSAETKCAIAGMMTGGLIVFGRYADAVMTVASNLDCFE